MAYGYVSDHDVYFTASEMNHVISDGLAGSRIMMMRPSEAIKPPSRHYPSPIDVDLDSLADKLWEKLYNRPAIVPCPWCSSHNAVSNPGCVQCGGPLGA